MFYAGSQVDIRPTERAMTPGASPIPLLAHGIVERVDDYCAVAFTVCKEAQAVPRLDVALAIADIERKPYEPVPPQEAMASTFTHSEAEEVHV